MRFHVTFKENKKLLEVQELEMKSFLAALAVILPDVSMKKALVQWYMKEVDDWVDIDNTVVEEWASHKESAIKKIRIIQEDSLQEMKLVKQNPANTAFTESLAPESTKTSEPENTEHIESETNRLPGSWPQWPKYAVSNEVLQLLEAKQPINRTHEMRICDAFYNYAVKYGLYYPKSLHYEKMAECVLTTFPHLAGHNTSTDAKVYWKEKLKYKFQNNRRRQDKDVEVCMARKRKGEHVSELQKKKPTATVSYAGLEYAETKMEELDCVMEHAEKDDLFPDLFPENISCDSKGIEGQFDCSDSSGLILGFNDSCASPCRDEDNTFTKDDARSTAQYGLEHFLPPRPESETSETIQCHIKNMRQEWKRREPNRKKLRTLMDLTFSERRAFIVQQAPDVSQVLEKYPILTDVDELLKEFMRLKPCSSSMSGVEEQLLSGLNRHSDALIQQLEGKNVPVLFKSLQEAMSRACEKKRKKYIAACLALLGVPFLIGERYQYLVDSAQTGNENKVCFVSYKGELSSSKTFTVTMEEVKYDIDDMIKAIAVLAAGIYVFHMQYPKELSGTWIFIQKFLLGITDGTKTPKKVVRLLSHLN